MPGERVDILVDHQDRLAGRLEAREAAPDLVADQRRQPFRRLVENEQPRVGHQRAADGEHLLLAAGEQVAPCCRRRSASRGKSAQTSRASRDRRAAAVGGGRDQIFPRGQIGKDLPALRHQAEAELGDAIGRQAANVAAVEADRAGARPASAP